MGDIVTVTFTNSSSRSYVVNNVLKYQATDPDNFNQPFLNSKGQEVPTIKVFTKAYKNNGLTFQTCIAAEGYSSWGLLFVQAVPQK